MQQPALVAQQFGNTASAYLTSAVHAQGADLTALRDIAAGFANSKEFADLYGSAPSNADIVLRLYHNILHREPDAGGYQYWLGILDNKQATLPYVLAFFSESAENLSGTAALIANGIVYTPYGI